MDRFLLSRVYINKLLQNNNTDYVGLDSSREESFRERAV
jgi:hypothetical protein